MKALSSRFPFWYEFFTVSRSSKSHNSVSNESFDNILNNNKLSVTINKSIAYIRKFCRSYLTIYVISNDLADEVSSPIKEVRITPVDLIEFQYNGWYWLFLSFRKMMYHQCKYLSVLVARQASE